MAENNNKKTGIAQRQGTEKEIETLRNSLASAVAALGGLGINAAAFGTSQASQADTFFKNNRWYMISNIRQLLSQTYAEHGIVQTLVDLPVDDGFRGGVEITSPELDPEDTELLNYRLERGGAITAFIQALKWMRLFGGAGLIIIDGQSPEKTFSAKDLRQGGSVQFKPCDMWELYYGLVPQDPGKDTTETPGVEKRPEFYDYYGHKIHHTRVIRFEGRQAPSLIRAKLRGWGTSVLETVVRSYNQYLKSVDLSFEVLDEFKVDYFKIDGFNSAMMSPQGTNRILERVRLANMSKNYQEAVSMDTKDDIVTKQLNFTGIAEIMQQIRMQIAADLRMPLTKLFGISAAGFNSGEDDIENYNAMIETEIRSKCREQLLRVAEICSMECFGTVPERMEISFKPLRVLSAEQEETVKNAKMTRIMQAMAGGIMTPQEARQAINKEQLLPVAIEEDEELYRPEGPTAGDRRQEEGQQENGQE